MTITTFVSVGDKVDTLCSMLAALNVEGATARIRRQGQVDDIWTHNGASVHEFQGTVDEVLEYLYDRCCAATGYPNSTGRCKFVLPTVIDIMK